jgi:hypothetical protein
LNLLESLKRILGIALLPDVDESKNENKEEPKNNGGKKLEHMIG